MTGRNAWSRGFAVLSRHPWLALIPAGWDLLQLALAWLGVPLGPVMDATRLLDRGLQLGNPTPNGVSFTAFLPSALPSIANLKVAMQPAALAAPVSAGRPTLLASTLLIPLLEAFVTALFLGLLADLTAGRPITLRTAAQTAVRRMPALLALLLGGRLAYMLLPAPVIVAGIIAAMLLWPLLPYALGAAGQSLWEGLSGAPHELWGRLGDWISLGFRAALANGLFFLLWSLMGRPVAVALAVYPLLATALVAGATALYTHAPEEIAPDPPGSPALLLTFPVLVGGALAGWSLLNSWAGWYPSPLTAIAAQDYQPGQYAAADAYRIRYSVQEANTQLVIWQGGPRSYMGLTRLEQGRFGWKILRHDPSFPLMDPHAPADIRFTRLDDGAVYWGEIFDDRVAYLQALGARFPIGQEGPLFILPVTPPTAQYYGETVQILDRDGNPVRPKGD